MNIGYKVCMILMVVVSISTQIQTSEIVGGWWIENSQSISRQTEIVREKKEIELPRWAGYIYAYWSNPSAIVWWMLAKGVHWLVEISQKQIENQLERLSAQAPYLLHTSWEKPVSEGILKIEIAVIVSVQRPIYQLTTTKPIHQLTGSVIEENAEESGQENPPPKKRKWTQKSRTNQPSKGKQRICVPIEQEKYTEILDDPKAFRRFVDEMVEAYPELFPSTIKEGYKLDGFTPQSKKMPEVRIRRIRLKTKPDDNCGVYAIAPSFVLPYMRGYTDDVEQALFLRRFGVPYWALTHLFGRNDMYWYRLMTSLGRNSVVGTTLKQPKNLPTDILVDEKHTRLNGNKSYIATTVAGGCVLGASISMTADTVGLTQAYGHFKYEALNLDPAYAPKTVNEDGWSATHSSLRSLFEGITPIRCFLHSFIKIRSRCKNQPFFPELRQLVWHTYHAPDKKSFTTRTQELEDWAQLTMSPGPALDSVLKLCQRRDLFLHAYQHPSAYRTSNALDREMQCMDRYLSNHQYFHGHLSSAELGIRAWALLHNFRPYCPRSAKKLNFTSPAHRLNGSVYHQSWLHNLFISSSMAGFRT